VAELCARLEGIPLALELAAARMRSLSIQDINKRLNDRFKLLTGGGRVLLERQQTLRALVAWSYDLLHEPEQRLLERLSVFAGGFDLEAAEAVCGAAPLAPEDVLDLLTSLVEKSLVMIDERKDETRYRQLETIREFAREYLTKRDDAAAIAVRHCDHFLVMAKAANKGLRGPEQAKWTRRLEVELDNLRAAVALALANGVEPVNAVKFEVALMNFRILRGYSTEASNNIRAALAIPGLPDIARCHALYVGGALATRQGDHAGAMTMLTECLALRRALGNPRETAGTLSTLAVAHRQQGDTTRARECAEEALGTFRELGDRVGEAIGLLHLGEICMQLIDDRTAREHFEKCLAIVQSIKHQEMEGECERNLGELALAAGDLPAAQERFAQSLQICRDAEDKRNESIALWCLGKTDAVTGDQDSAGRRFAEALSAFRALEMRDEALDCLEDCAVLLQAVGESGNAVRVQAAAAAVRHTLALRRSPRNETKWRRNVDAARAAIGEPTFDAAWSDGSGWTLDAAIDCALASIAIRAVTA
jgi:non-specific serine/threonine protein kinase